MARYILIDNESGFIFADTADLVGFDTSAAHGDDAIIDAARCLNASIGYNPDDFSYEINYRLGGENHYTVYRVDIDGSEAVAIVQDGQDQEVIEAVERDCEFVGSVKVTNLTAGD
ncbi:MULTISPECIES: hypothetical protein [unclassified Novosphingobium]|uniref:hypothetical protein n=1 Tax=unclassified Novosphingobium TaxID=2644732 RepID=UPI000D30D740|nr:MULTISPECIES: hypothetical protein [unclassified Novosphingobium]PTR07881.1 hypothetical protein C8K11_11392 [Novosphingobium sp. GV055]PUB00694.1 hypothetical protein C8K12_11392 [Novosphingobium sp. GV061]PUB16103.1 hypothetical protein C8K14_11392 [Novosphingobium sp. GV079]PUB39568.1 hypothetical protein C8K10_11392 [Novosphingobium sp. GV027]